MMKTYFTSKFLIIASFLITMSVQYSQAQICEWRLTNATYDATDPDAGGPATGSATFTLQIRTTGGSIDFVSGISLGYSYQSAMAMIPSSPGCGTAPAPSNITLSSAFNSASFSVGIFSQCNSLTQNAGGQTVDRIASGSITSNGAGLTLTTAWTDVFTVTLWTLGNSNPHGGYVALNAGAGGSPTPTINNWEVSDVFANPYVVNSLSFDTPLALGGTVPVLFTKFDAKCNNNGTIISWATAQEINSSKFEIERSDNGTHWKTVGSVAANGNSSVEKTYQQLDLSGGSALYRIKQIDMNGAFTYTGIERTNCQVKNISTVIYPVPAKELLNVVIKSDITAKTQLLVYDMSGKLISRKDVSIVNGNNNFTINLGRLNSGDYILRSSNNAVELNKIFTVIK